MTTQEEAPRHCDVCGNNYTTSSSDAESETPCPSCGSRTWYDRGRNQRIAVVNASYSLESELLEKLTDIGYVIILDFSQVDHIASSVPVRLLALDKSLRMHGNQLRLAGFKPDVMNILKIARLDSRFEIFESSTAALESLST